MKSKNHLFPLLMSCFLLLGASLQTVKATHIAGADIRYTCTGTPGIFEVTLILYRFCDGVPLCPDTCGASCTQTLQIRGADPSCSALNFGSVTLSLVNVRDINTEPSCPSAKSTCTNMGCVTPGSYTPAIERYEFNGFANIGPTSGIPSSCCNVRFAYSYCCRGTDVSTGQAGENFYTDAIINRCLSLSPCNSSPILTNDPLLIACSGNNYVFNNGAVDPDSDSLSYQFTPALVGFGTSVTYTPPFTFEKPMPWTGNANGQFPQGIHCNPVNGDIQFMPPQSAGLFSGVMAVQIRQWKKINGTFTVAGITRRDIQVYLRGDCIPNNLPAIVTDPPFNGNPSVPKTEWEICAGEQLCFNVIGRDTDFNPPVVSDTTYLSWNASLSNLGATFTPDYNPIKRHFPDSLGGGPREDRYRFCWTPTIQQASATPYYFTVSAKDDRCPNPGKKTQSFSIRVFAKPEVSIQKNIDTCGRVHLSFTNTNPSVQVGDFLWQITFDTNAAPVISIPNQNPVIFNVKDTGIYHLRLLVRAAGSPPSVCSRLVDDTMQISQHFLIDSLITLPPTCSNTFDGSIEVFALFGNPPYQYSLNLNAFGSTSQFTTLGPGTYSVRTKDARGCVAEQKITFLKERLLRTPIHGESIVMAGETKQYSSTFPASVIPTWTVINGNIISGQGTETVNIVWTTKGMGSVTLIGTDSTCDDTLTQAVAIGFTGIKEIYNPMGVTVFPNPTQSNIKIQIQHVSSNTQIQLYNILGKLLMEQPATNTQQLQIESLPNGIYFLKVGDWTTRIVKQ